MLHLPHRPYHPRHRVAALALGLSALPLVLLPATAHATTDPSPKAAIEHAEQLAAEATQPNQPNQPNKAQIEHHEVPLMVPVRLHPQPESGSTGDAAVWQLAMSAALGAALTGVAVVTSRRMGQRHHVATS